MSGVCTTVHARAEAHLATMPDASVDAIVTDPPYELAFMGKAWDGTGIAFDPAMWAEALRVLKPGGHLLAFGGTRTHHRLAVAIEDAGFELRDTITWLYGSGFPKAKGVLKPAHEPIVVARRRPVGSVARNVAAYGTGAINVDACRVPGPRPDTTRGASRKASSMAGPLGAQGRIIDDGAGRWPTNVVLSHDPLCGDPDAEQCPDCAPAPVECVDGCPVAELDQQSGTRRSGLMRAGVERQARGGWAGPMPETTGAATYGDEGGASRFFPTFRYQAKAPARERPTYVTPDGVRIAHATVKPLDLMRWLVRLVTPPGGTVLDPFAGSGTTGEAAILEGFNAVLIEAEAEHLPLISQRLDRVTP